MESLLHYTWKHRLYARGALVTTDGRRLEVLDAGLHNTNAGPDFLNAKVKLDGELWAGNVEIHTLSTDWVKHGHEQDEAYNNVVLHVVETANAEVWTQDGKLLPQVCIKVPVELEQNYWQLLHEERYPPCFKIIPQLAPVVWHQWLDYLCVERLEEKTNRINTYAQWLESDWERVFFLVVARSFGFGVNGEAFEYWGRLLYWSACARHRDSLWQLEAMFLGTAGLLEDDMIPSFHREAALQDGYFKKLQSEWRFLQHKFEIVPMDGKQWKFLRMRPQNFPHIRLVQLAKLYHSTRLNLSAILDATTLPEVHELLQTEVTPYWETHYGFGAESAKSAKRLQKSTLNLLVINAIVPMLFAYGRHRQKEAYCEKALRFLSELKPERNHFITAWCDLGVVPQSAADSQAILQLQTRYCQRKDCLRCRFGYYYLKGKLVATSTI